MRYLVLALLLSGCTDYTERCEKIVDHTIEVGVREYTAEMDETQKQKFVEDVQSRRSATLKACKKGKPSQEDTDCALAGTTLAEINTCAWYRKAGVGGVR
jgi:hypothetical protein